MPALRSWSLALSLWTASAVYAQYSNDLYMETCSQVIPCLAHYPSPHYGGGTPPSRRMIPGLVVNISRTARPGDYYCTSGRCVILDPGRLCNAYDDDCVPLPNIPTPHLPCDRRNPDCPPNGIYVYWDRTCHPSDPICGPGSVISNPQPCRNGEPGCNNCVRLPPWRTVCGPSVNDARCTIPGRTFITDPVDPNYPCGCKPRESVPGIRYPWPPAFCDPRTPGCTGREHVVPIDRTCTTGEAGCIARDQIEPCTDASADPRCPRGSKCCLVLNEPCHPNDKECRGIPADPIPCAHGTPKCENGIKLPHPPITGCRAGDPICQPGGPSVPPRPGIPSDQPHFPAHNGRLVYSPYGSLTCQFVPLDEPQDGIRRGYLEFLGSSGGGQQSTPTDPTSGYRDGFIYQDHTEYQIIGSGQDTGYDSAPVHWTLDYQNIGGHQVATGGHAVGPGTFATRDEAAPIDQAAPTGQADSGSAPIHWTLDYENVGGHQVATSVHAVGPGTFATMDEGAPIYQPVPTDETVPSHPGVPIDQKVLDSPVASPPTSKFPCSISDSMPCKGALVRDWEKARNFWSRTYPKPGPPGPYPLHGSAEPFARPTILEVVDGKHQTSHYAIMIDGQVVAESDEGKVYQRENLACNSGDDCVAKGLGHVFALIPAGEHHVEVAVTDNVVETFAGMKYKYVFDANSTRCPERTAR